MFIGQLEPLPSSFVDFEKKACAALFPGPANWITVDALKGLSALGLPWSLRDIPSAVLASKARVYEFEAAGRLHIWTRSSALLNLISEEADLSRVEWLRTWRDQLFLVHLDTAHRRIKPLLTNLPPAVVLSPTRIGCQKAVSRLLRPSFVQAAHNFSPFMHRSLGRPTYPGYRAPRAHRLMTVLGSGGPPRIVASYLRLLANGVCTSRRFRTGGCCRFGCGHFEDSVFHFAYCPVVRHLARLAGLLVI